MSEKIGSIQNVRNAMLTGNLYEGKGKVFSSQSLFIIWDESNSADDVYGCIYNTHYPYSYVFLRIRKTVSRVRLLSIQNNKIRKFYKKKVQERYFS